MKLDCTCGNSRKYAWMVGLMFNCGDDKPSNEKSSQVTKTKTHMHEPGLSIEQLEQLIFTDNRAKLLEERIGGRTENRLMFRIINEQAEHPEAETALEKTLLKELHDHSYSGEGLSRELAFRRTLKAAGDSDADKRIMERLSDLLSVSSMASRFTAPFIAQESGVASSSASSAVSTIAKLPTPAAFIKDAINYAYHVSELHPLAITRVLSSHRSVWMTWDTSEMRALVDTVRDPKTDNTPLLQVINRFYALANAEKHSSFKQEIPQLDCLTMTDRIAFAGGHKWYHKSTEFHSRALAAVAPPVPPGSAHLPLHAPALAAFHDTVWDYAMMVTARPNIHYSLLAAVLQHHADRGEFPKDRFMKLLHTTSDIYPMITAGSIKKALKTWRDKVAETIVRFDVPCLTQCTDLQGLVRAFLMNLAPDMKRDDVKALTKLADEDWVEATVAEAKILADAPDAADWHSVLGRDRVDSITARRLLEFDRTPQYYRREDPVEIRLAIKHYDTVRVSVYSLAAADHMAAAGEAPGAGLDVSGFVPNTVHTLPFTSPRQLRHVETVKLDCGPGTHIVEASAGAASVRALIQVGELRAVTEDTPDGHLVTVIDETGAVAHEATITVDGTPYPAPAGSAVVPHTRRPGPRQTVLTQGAVATMTSLTLSGEAWALACGMWVDRHALVPGHVGHVTLRPVLTLNGVVAPRTAALEARAAITTTDVTGQTSTLPEEPVDMTSALPTVPVTVPAGVVTVEVTVTVRVPLQLAGPGEEPSISLTARQTFRVNQAAHGDDSVLDSHIVVIEGDAPGRKHPAARSYMAIVAGKNGEPYPGLSVTVAPRYALRPEWSNTNHTAACDAQGRVFLGPMTGVESVTISHRANPRTDRTVTRRHKLTAPPTAPLDRVTVPHGAGLDLPMPWGPVDPATPTELQPVVSLFSLVSCVEDGDALVNTIIDDLTPLLTIINHGTTVTLPKELPEGRFKLVMHALSRTKPYTTIIDVLPARAQHVGEILATETVVADPAPAPAAIVDVVVAPAADGLAVTVRTAHTTSDAVLTVTATPTPPVLHPTPLLTAGPERATLDSMSTTPSRTVLSGAGQLSDEDKYVLERQTKPGQIGCLLPKPELLLHARQVADTTQQAKKLDEGVDHFGAAPSRRTRGGARAKTGAATIDDATEPDGVSVDHMPASTTATPLSVTGPEMKVLLPADPCCCTVLVTLVDDCRVTTWTVPRPAPRDSGWVGRVDLRAARTDPDVMTVHARGVTALAPQPGPAAQPAITFQDWSTTTAHQLTSLTQLYRMMAAPGLAQYRPLLEWDTLDTPARLALHPTVACDEVHLMLWARDRPFFDRWIRPILSTRPRPSLVDKVLLGLPVTEKDHPAHSLNMMELVLLAHAVPAAAPGIVDHITRMAPARLSPDLANRAADLLLSVQAAPTAPPPPPCEAPCPVPPSQPCGMFEMENDEEAEMSISRQSIMDSVKKGRRGPSRPRPRPVVYPDNTGPVSYVERAWHGTPPGPTPGMFRPNLWWVDLVHHAAAGLLGRAPFVSPHVPLMAIDGSPNAALAALALTDLPLSAGTVQPALLHTPTGLQATLTAPAAMIVVHTQQQPSPTPPDGTILIRQALFDPTGDVPRGQTRAYIDPAAPLLLPGFIVGIETVLTNLSPRPARPHIALTLPEGALPVGPTPVAVSLGESIPPFSSRTITRYVYWPTTGTFTIPPGHASEAGRLLGRSTPQPPVSVVDVIPKDRLPVSWAAIAVHGTPREIAEYLAAPTTDLTRTPLPAVYHRTKDKAAWRVIVDALEGLGLYDDKIWAMAVVHKDSTRLHRLLAHHGTDRTRSSGGAANLREGLRPSFASPIVTLDDVVLGLHRFLEYRPIVADRAFKVGATLQIDNDKLRAQYLAHLQHAAHRVPTAMDDLKTAYYLVLLDRFPEARRIVPRLEAHYASQSGQAPIMVGGMTAPTAFRCDACATPIVGERHSCGRCPGFDLCANCYPKWGPRHTAADHPGQPDAFVPAQTFLALQGELQWDYLAAFMDFVDQDSSLSVARRVAAKYRDFPIVSWRSRFAALQAQLDDIDAQVGQAFTPGADGAGAAPIHDAAGDDGRDDLRQARGARAAGNEPSISAVYQPGTHSLLVTAANVPDGQVEVAIHPANTEQLFTSSPLFREAGGVRLDLVRPTDAIRVTLTGPSTTVPLPPVVQDAFIEVTGLGCRDSLWAIRSGLSVGVVQHSGLMRVTRAGTDTPVPKVYCKVYAAGLDGVRFHRDGHTDRRGMFEFAAGIIPEGTTRFAVLAASADLGCTVKTVPAPRR